MSAERLLAIRARAEAASAGPWRVEGQPDEVKSISGPLIASGGIVRTESLATDVEYDADAEFIVHARQDVPWLLQQIANRDHVISLLRRAESWDAVHSIFVTFDASEAQS